MGQINGETQPSVLSSVGPACGFGFTEDCDDFRLSWMGEYSGKAERKMGIQCAGAK